MLTSRRGEFLARLVAMSRQQEGPVRYADLGAALGVSRWTAYDVLKRLERDGYVRAAYSAPAGPGRGRSQVLFEPAILVAPSTAADPDEWARLERHARSCMARLESAAPATVIDELGREVSRCRTPLGSCLLILAALLLCLKALDAAGLQSLRQLLDAAGRPEVAVSLFAGAAAGALYAAQDTVRRPLVDYLRRFQRRFAAVKSEDHGLLLRFLRDALDQAAAGAPAAV